MSAQRFIPEGDQHLYIDGPNAAAWVNLDNQHITIVGQHPRFDVGHPTYDLVVERLGHGGYTLIVGQGHVECPATGDVCFWFEFARPE